MQKIVQPINVSNDQLFRDSFIAKPVLENKGFVLKNSANNDPINCTAFYSIINFQDCPLWVASTEQAIFYAGFISPEFPVGWHQVQAQKRNKWLIDNDISERKQALPSEYLLIGTSFQQAIWHALTNIPLGKLCTYKTLGQWLKPICTGYQAIGRAVGANPIGGLIPCHRVVAASGQLSGFRWGVNIKHLLLNAEIAHRNNPPAIKKSLSRLKRYPL